MAYIEGLWLASVETHHLDSLITNPLTDAVCSRLDKVTCGKPTAMSNGTHFAGSRVQEHEMSTKGFFSILLWAVIHVMRVRLLGTPIRQRQRQGEYQKASNK